MTSDKWNIDIAAFANGLAVVHGLKYGEQTRVFLYKPRERVEITSSFMGG